MRAKGIAYDTGFIVRGTISRAQFDPEVVRRELAIIRDDLHCNAVQIIGGDPDRLELAAGYAAELGLEVWFSPYPLELTADEILSLFTDCAQRAERLRNEGAEVVFVTGVELTLMNRGCLPGDTWLDGEYIRDETVQATYLREVLEILDDEGVDGAFVFLFALHNLPHRPGGDPRDDLDMASLGIVKVLEGRRGDTYPDMPWEPKAAFAALAEYYSG